MKSTVTIYQLSDRLREARSVRVSAEEIGPTMSTWLAEVGAATPLVDDLAQAVRAADWTKVHELSDYLSVEVTVSGVAIASPRVRPIRSLKPSEVLIRSRRAKRIACNFA